MAVLGIALCPALVRASPSAPDSVAASPDPSAAVEAASVSPQSPRVFSPMGALGVGIAATAAPPLLVLAASSSESRSEHVGLSVGVVTGIVVGPAFGLWSGGRGDLAKRGLITRVIGGAAIGAGALGGWIARNGGGGNAPPASAALVILGLVGGA